MGVSCAACHVCRSGIRVNWTNPSPRNKNYKSHQCKFGQTNHQRICRSASHFLFHRRVGGWYRSEFAFRMVVSRRLATKLSRGSTHKHTRNLANWSCRLVSSPYGFSRFRDITKLWISQALPIQRRTGPFEESSKRRLATGCLRSQWPEAICQVQPTSHGTVSQQGWKRSALAHTNH